ncbi:MAG: 4a-hydroxytetrahydrobiopterin dehydratase [Actinomycetota bacterium]
MARLTDADVAAALATLPGWVRHGDARETPFELPTFPAAVAFVVAVADRAEAANHHPDLDLRWRRVRCALTTHDEGGLTDKDVALAREIDAAAGTVA